MFSKALDEGKEIRVICFDISKASEFKEREVINGLSTIA
jgi:predicted protein tyrosine phosphatase